MVLPERHQAEEDGEGDGGGRGVRDYERLSNAQLAITLRLMAEADRQLYGAKEMETSIAVLEEAARRLEEVGES